MKIRIFLSYLLLLTLISCQEDNLNDSCSINGLSINAGECNDQGTYPLTISFEADNADNAFFELWLRDSVLLGTFPLDQLPLNIPNFSPSGLPNDFIEICINDNTDCCRQLEFDSPACEVENDCPVISDLTITPGDCNNALSYALTIDFEHDFDSNDFVYLSTRNQAMTYTKTLDELPFVISDFPVSDFQEDYIQICIADSINCCFEEEWVAPECGDTFPCSISNLEVAVGGCTDNGNYKLTINFNHDNAGNDFFDLYLRSDSLYNFYALADLPLTIDNFIPSGSDYDYIKVCINDNPDCCKEIEFMPPDCNPACEISDLTASIGNCTSTNTYELTIDFDHVNAGNDFFDLYVRNDVLIDYYSLSDLPLTIPDFPLSGNDDDFIRVCINDNPNCCQILEFESPDCGSNTACEIRDLSVEYTTCQDSVYNVTIDFIYENTGNDFFEVTTNGAGPYGPFSLGDLPLTLDGFIASGKDNDHIEVCIVNDPNCCAAIEWDSPCPQ